MRTLRDYQRAGIDKVRELLEYDPLLVSPTGSGKTFMLATLVEELRRPTLWVAHRRELIDQAHRQLCGLGLRAGVIMAGEPVNHFAQVQVASVQTLARRDNPAGPGWLTIVDEAHHSAASSYAGIFETGSDVIGCTATPFRLDGAGLGDLFGSLVVAATPKDLVDRGVLIRPRVLCAPSPPLEGVRVVAGEFNIADVAERVDTQRLVGDVVEIWKKRGGNGRTLVFAVNIAHSIHIVEAFNKAGVPAAHIDGETDPVQREVVLQKLRAGSIRVVSNVSLLTEGWDLPALDVLIMAKPTASLCLHQQMAGRVVRSHEGKDSAMILDHAGNHLRHGEIIRELQYSLEPGSNATSSPRLGVKVCPKCYGMFPVSQWQCPQCGNDCRPQAPPIQHEPGDLRDYVDTTFAGREREWQKIEALREQMGFHASWSVMEYRRRFGSLPILVERRLIDVERAALSDRIAIWNDFDQERQRYGFDRGWSDHRYREVFGSWPTPDVRLSHAKAKLTTFVATKGERQWSGKARTAGSVPSKAGPESNPYAKPDAPWRDYKLKPWRTSDDIPF